MAVGGSGGGSMFELFTEGAKNVILVADREARTRGHRRVDTAHLLLAVTEVSDGLAVRVLHDLGFDLPPVRERLLAALGPTRGNEPEVILFTDGVKRSLELAWRESRALGHDRIDTHHLLLGLVRHHDDIVAAVLRGIDLDSVREHVIQATHGETAEGDQQDP